MALINIQYTADISQLNAKLDQIIQKQERVSSTSKKAGDDMSNAAKKATEEIKKVSKETGVLGNSLDKVGGLIATAFAVSKLVDFTKAIVDAERKMELLQNRLNFLAGSQQKGEELFERLFLVSKRLGLNIEDLAEGMASFGIAATQAGFSALKTEKIFVQVASGLRAAGATSLQTQRSFYALQQMMSKGVVAAEELRRQLGESLPGAFSLMVTAYNRLHPEQQLTELQFTKLQEQGKIISREILPEFAKVIEETFAPALAGKANSLDAAIQKVNTELLALKLNLANTKVIKFFVDAVATESNRLNMILQSQESGYGKLARIIGDVLLPLGFLNNDLINEQRALTQLSAAESAKINNDIINQSEELLKMSGKERDAKIESIKLSLKEDQQVIDSYNEKLKLRNLEIEFKKKAQAQEIKDGKKTYLLEGGMANAHAKQLEEINAKYYSHAEKGEFLLAKKRVKINQGVIEEMEISEKLLSQSKNDELDAQKKAQEQFLRDEVARADRARLKTQEGSIAESEARAVLAEKQKNLNEFMAKSDATMQLARLKGEIETNERIEEARLKTADALSDIVVEEEIDPSKDPALKRIDKELETYAKNKDEIVSAIAAPFLSAQELEISAAISKYEQLINLTKENSNERKLLEEALQKDLENIAKKYQDKEAAALQSKIKRTARAMGQIVSETSAIINGFGEADRKMRENQLNAELQILSSRFEAGILSEGDYQAKVNEIKRRQFKIDQDSAIAKIRMDTATAIINLFAQLPWPAATALVPAVAGLAITQIDAVKSTPMPTFHEGGIDIGGDSKKTSGPLKSDEFIAKLQRGESVIDRQDTQRYKDELSAIRNGKFEDYIASKYILPALERSVDKKQSTSGQTSMEMAFQAAEMVNAIKGNKVIKLHKSSIKELAGHIGQKASDKIIARRSWR